MLLAIQELHKLLGRAFVVSLMLVLSACGLDYSSVLLGTWKDVNQERYLTIEKSAEADAALSAIIYAPAATTERNDGKVVMNHLTMPAVMQNGLLMLEVEAGYIPVLYDSTNQLVVLNGTDKYQRVPEAVAQLKLESVRSTNH